MAQKKASPQTQYITPMLTTSKEDFKTAIAERIDLGKELLNKLVTTNEE